MKILIVVLMASFLLHVPQDRSDKRCVVTEVLEGGTKSDCGGWEAAKGEKVIMPADINRRLKVGSVFYFTWQEDRWIAIIKD